MKLNTDKSQNGSPLVSLCSVQQGTGGHWTVSDAGEEWRFRLGRDPRNGHL